ncbi:MAG: CvpA family protein, partial [Ruminococcus sp.]|nr:CvpA family protein [Candidatus Copronaster equi]
FIFFGLIIKAICMLINKVFELPLLKQVNKALGLLLGMVCGIFCVIVLSVCLQIGSKVVYNDEYKSFVDNSYIVQFIVSNEQTVKEVASQQKSEG